MSFGKSRRWIDWVPNNAFLAPGQRQDVQRDPQFSFAAAVKSRGPVAAHGAGFGSAVKRDLDPVPRRRSRSKGNGRASGASGVWDDEDGPPVYTQFKGARRSVWGRSSGTFGSSRREVAVSWRAVQGGGHSGGCGCDWQTRCSSIADTLLTPCVPSGTPHAAPCS